MVMEKLVPLALVMAARFGEPVSDAKEVSLRAGAIPDNTKVSTEWGIRIWNEWATSRATAVAAGGIAPLTTPLLEMSRVDLGYCAISSYCTLKCPISDLLHTF